MPASSRGQRLLLWRHCVARGKKPALQPQWPWDHPLMCRPSHPLRRRRWAGYFILKPEVRRTEKYLRWASYSYTTYCTVHQGHRPRLTCEHRAAFPGHTTFNPLVPIAAFWEHSATSRRAWAPHSQACAIQWLTTFSEQACHSCSLGW